MKHAFSYFLAGLLMAAGGSSITMAQSQSQSLGDYARAVKKNTPTPKSAPKSYDNENLPGSSALSVVGNSPETDRRDKDKEAGSKPVPDTKADVQKKPEPPEVKAGQSSDEREKAIAAWKQKIDEQKVKTDLLTREFDVTQREFRLRSNAYYSDISNRLRGSGEWQAEEAKYKQQIAEKQKALDEAKARLSDLREQARKSGVPNSAAE
jgi:hypothetical protein